MLVTDCCSLRSVHEREVAEEGGYPTGGQEVERFHWGKAVVRCKIFSIP